jgi:hypothetical protein
LEKQRKYGSGLEDEYTQVSKLEINSLAQIPTPIPFNSAYLNIPSGSLKSNNKRRTLSGSIYS